MDQTTGTQTSTDTTRPSFDKAPAADAFAAPPLPGAGYAEFGPATPPARRPFRMQRSRTDRMIAGVCGGLAESLGVDATLLRITFVAITLLGGGIGIPLYIAAWILAPEADLG